MVFSRSVQESFVVILSLSNPPCPPQAVYVLKSSPRLVLDVLRGAGLDLVAGESSGYNSSASSVAGDQTPPSSSSSDPRDSDHSIASR